MPFTALKCALQEAARSASRETRRRAALDDLQLSAAERLEPAPGLDGMRLPVGNDAPNERKRKDSNAKHNLRMKNAKQSPNDLHQTRSAVPSSKSLNHARHDATNAA
jgi:hypothetical protein